MDFSVTLVNLAGSVALLLWGVHMVQTGVQRALGARLRSLLGTALRNRFQALLAKNPENSRAAEGNSPASMRAAPTSACMRSISSVSVCSKRVREIIAPSLVRASWASHCHNCERQISAVAASSIR